MIDRNDAAHDLEHAIRVMNNAIRISKAEGGDPDVLIPAALFHDVVMYPKDDPRSATAAVQSATTAQSVLLALDGYDPGKIPAVEDAIVNCSFGNEASNLSHESQILQDADRLEATGAIAVMRTFWSAGQMGHPLYCQSDPMAVNRTPDGLTFALDLFWTRLLQVENHMNTETGRTIARDRSKFLRSFLEQFEHELH